MRYQKQITVYCPECKDHINEKKTKFVNIEEGIQGEDILTFICPTCKKQQKSRRFS